MVERGDLQRANDLVRQHAAYRTAIEVLTHKPRMVSFTIASDDRPDPNDEDRMWQPVTVSADDIDTPPQMLSAIKSQIETRIKAINDELTEMGVGTSPPPPEVVPPWQPPPEAEDARTTPPKPASAPPAPAHRPSAHTPPHKGRR